MVLTFFEKDDSINKDKTAWKRTFRKKSFYQRAAAIG